MVTNTVPPPKEPFDWLRYVCVAHAEPYRSIPQNIGFYWIIRHMRAIAANQDKAVMQMTMRLRGLRPRARLCCVLGDDVMNELAHQFKHRKGGLSADRPPHDPEWDS